MLVRAKEAGVEEIIVPAVNLKDGRSVLDIVKKREGLWELIGLYPGEGQKKEEWKEDLQEIEKMVMEEEKIVGIGEIGLDGYWNKRNLEMEKEMFAEQLKMAVRLGVPVAIHNRDAEEEIREVFESMEELPAGQMHCWSGSEEFLNYCLEKGFYIGFDGNVSYPSNNDLRKMVAMVPSDRLLLETDSPYLPPQEKRGEVNEPANVKILAEFLAGELKVDVTTLINQTGENAKKLYRLKE